MVIDLADNMGESILPHLEKASYCCEFLFKYWPEYYASITKQ